MELAETQRTLARLCSDAASRDAFFAEEGGAGHAGLPRDQIERFGRTLRRKRLAQLSRALPLTSAVLGDRFANEFQRYAVRPAPTGSRKYLADAIQFAAYLEQAACLAESPWVSDLIRWERSWLEMADPSNRIRFRLFRWGVGELTIRDCQGQQAPEVKRGWMASLWFRAGRMRRLCYIKFPR